MNALQITLYADKPVTLPLAYNELVQGALYGFWRDTFPQLHDEGFEAEDKTFRLFTFGPLTGKCHIDGKAKEIRFEGAVRLEVRTPVDPLLDVLVEELVACGGMRIGRHELQLVNLQKADRLLFQETMVVHMLAPVVAHRTLADKQTLYFAPGDDDWLKLIGENAARKAQVCGLSCDPNMQIIPLPETLKKRVTTFKGFYITGWVGDLIVHADPKLLSSLYYTGLGAKNSQGFGMFDIVDRPL